MLIARRSYHVWCRCYSLSHIRTVCGRLSFSNVKNCNWAQLRNGRMFYNHFVNRDRCRLTTNSSENEISQRLSEIQTTDELLNFVSVVDSESWTPELTALLNDQLVSTHYQSLYAVHPWLRSDVGSANRQLLQCGQLVIQAATAPIHNHCAYETWMSIVERNCASCSADQLASALLSATSLFVDLSSKFVHGLLSETHRRLPEFDVTALAALMTSLKFFPGNNEILVRLATRQAHTLLTNTDSVNAPEFTGLVSVFHKLSMVLSTDFKCQVVQRLLEMVENNQDVLVNPVCAEAILQLWLMHLTTDKNKGPQFTNIGTEMCHRHIDQFTVSHVGWVSVLLKSCNRHGMHKISDVFNILESHAVHLLCDDNRLWDVIHLFSAVTGSTMQQVLLQFYSAIHSRLIDVSDIDAFTLSVIAKKLSYLKPVSTDLLRVVQQLIVRHADRIVCYPAAFLKIKPFLTQHQFLDKELETLFSDRLIAYLRKYDGVYTRYRTSEVSPYLLPVCSGDLPAPVFKQMISTVKHWHESEICRQISRISSVPEPLSSKYQLKQMNSVLYETLCCHLDWITRLGVLNHVAVSLLIRSRTRDPFVTDRIMNMYTQFSPNLCDNYNAFLIVSLFSTLRYYLPQVYDDLVCYIVNSDSVKPSLVLHTVAACAKVGYQPNGSKELLQLARDVYHDLFAMQKYHAAFRLLCWLNVLQLFLDDELSQLFTVETIEDIERYMADIRQPHYYRQTDIHLNRLMHLNRSVVLECPHLDVPWFSNQRSKYTRIVFQSRRTKEMAKEVESVVNRVLGGSQYVRCQTQSQYLHNIDFECLLDERRKPIDVLHWPHAEKTERCQKISVCVLGTESYCFNDRRMTGSTMEKKRQLEIMNYKFVEIPYFEWFSMGLCDQQAKCDYIEQKLFL